MQKIPLTQGKFAIVDDEDFPYISRFHWVVSREREAVREFTVAGKGVVIPMWKFVIGSESNKKCLYKNKNSLDVRKENIAIVPAYIANHYAGKKTRGVAGNPSSKYKGVSYSSTYLGRKKWIGNIDCNGKRATKHFFTEVEAAKFYNEKALDFYGEFAYQNKIN